MEKSIIWFLAGMLCLICGILTEFASIQSAFQNFSGGTDIYNPIALIIGGISGICFLVLGIFGIQKA